MLVDNDIGDDGAIFLGEALKTNSILRILKLKSLFFEDSLGERSKNVSH